MITARSSNSLGIKLRRSATSASEAVGVHVDASSKILREVELGAIPSGVRSHCMFEWLG